MAMERRWVNKPTPNGGLVEALSKKLNINSSLAAMLLQRGIADFDTAKAFFRPTLDGLHDPFLMKDMDRAVQRIQTAIDNNEKILVYGDYDVDGTTAVSLFFGFLSGKYPNMDYYIPDRYKEGYGISSQGIDWAKENGFALIISLDCGIKSVDKIEYANSLEIDFIICDHHNPGEELPKAMAVLDPKRADCKYPYKELSGCGVGFKLLQALCIANNYNQKELYQYLDLLAISIASDIVPITGENRIFMYFGLKLINNRPRPGVNALKEIAGLKKGLEVSSIVFGFAPRINAAGRIAHAKTAVELLLSKTEEEANALSETINDRNSQRKDFDKAITQEALQMIESDEELLQAKSTVLFKEHWHKGVIGIVASRCIEKHYKPTIIFTESNGHAAGSARSVDGFDVYEAISQCSDLLEQFGGHKYAAGLTLKVDNIPAFQKKFEEVVAASITEEQQIPQVEIDLAISFNQVNEKFYNIIKQMAPFGPMNMEPVFVTEEVYDTGQSRVLKGEHIKLHIRQKDSQPLEAIAFGMAQYFPGIATGKPFSLCYKICENEFNGKKSLQLLVRDIKFVD